MGLLAETVMSMSGAQVTTGEVAFQRSPMLTPLLLYFSTRGFEAPGSRQAPSIPYSPHFSLQGEDSLLPLKGQLRIP